MLLRTSMRFVILTLAMAAVATAAWAQATRSATMPTSERKEVVQRATNTEKLAPLDGNPTLFAVMAALNAAGYDTEIDSPTNNPLRKALREHLGKQSLPSLSALRRYVRDHRLPDAGADLGQYISFALLSKGAPDFAPALPNFTLPADVDRLRDFAPLLASFYKEAAVDKLWEAAQPAYDAALAPFTDPISRATQSVNGYFRNPGNQQTRGRFQVFVDLLSAPNQVHTRIYLEEYFVVVTPAPELPIDEIRLHYLRFWGDGLRFKFAPEITKLRPLGDYALASPLLAQSYRDDFLLFTGECLIRAIDARLQKQPSAPGEAMREGWVLTPAFYELLPKYEAQPDTLRNYFGDLLNGIDARKEAVRLDKIDFATERKVRTIRVTVEKPVVLTGVAKQLEGAEDLLRAQKSAEAKAAWTDILATTADRPAQARAYYGLGRVALVEKTPERADQLFRKVLELDADASTLAWTLVYLGKLADSQGEAVEAKAFYTRALAVGGTSEQVQKEAQQGMNGAFFRARPPHDADDEPTPELEEDLADEKL
jgi:tetratricopeptide (TPR) repeat protein